MSQIIVRCGNPECCLRQYQTKNSRCRKCGSRLPQVTIVSPGEEVEPDPIPPEPQPQERSRSGYLTGTGSTIGEQFLRVRTRMGITQQQMAEGMGLPRTYVSRIENTRILPGPDMLVRCAAFMQIDVRELLPQPALDPVSAEILSIAQSLKPEQQILILNRVKELISK